MREMMVARKVQERRLKWHGHVMRREEHYVGRTTMEMKVQGRRKRGGPKRRWLDRVRDDIKEKGLTAEEVTSVLHGGVCHRTSTPHKSGNKMKRKMFVYYSTTPIPSSCVWFLASGLSVTSDVSTLCSPSLDDLSLAAGGSGNDIILDQTPCLTHIKTIYLSLKADL